MRGGLRIALCALLLVACGKNSKSVIARDTSPSFEGARALFESAVASKYAKSLRVVSFTDPGGFVDVSEPRDWRTISAAYELECLATADVTDLMSSSLSGITTTTDAAHKRAYYRNGWVKTDDGFRISAIPLAPAVCAKGQRISFTGQLSFRKSAGDWTFVGQNPEPPSFESNKPNPKPTKG